LIEAQTQQVPPVAGPITVEGLGEALRLAQEAAIVEKKAKKKEKQERIRQLADNIQAQQLELQALRGRGGAGRGRGRGGAGYGRR
jgi:hypothetical protein